MKEAVKCCMQVWMCIRDFLAIVCTKEGEVVKKFFQGLKNVKVAIEASANYSYIVDALVKL